MQCRCIIALLRFHSSVQANLQPHWWQWMRKPSIYHTQHPRTTQENIPNNHKFSASQRRALHYEVWSPTKPVDHFPSVKSCESAVCSGCSTSMASRKIVTFSSLICTCISGQNIFHFVLDALTTYWQFLHFSAMKYCKKMFKKSNN